MKLFCKILLSSGIIFHSQCIYAECDKWNTKTSVKTYRFAKSLPGWGGVKFQFGESNLSYFTEHGNNVARVKFPANSFDPGSAAKGIAPLGGAQFTTFFRASGFIPNQQVSMSYHVRFDPKFDFVKGGKLPGFYGGIPRSGGIIPTGYDGYSTRIVWRADGKIGLYAYLPTSTGGWGTLLEDYPAYLKKGQWNQIWHTIKLNDVNKSNGAVALWLNGELVTQRCDLIFRFTDTLKVDGIFFSTFFGGNDPTWSSPIDTYADFGDFVVY